MHNKYNPPIPTLCRYIGTQSIPSNNRRSLRWTRLKICATVVFIITATGIPMSATAEIYRWVDKQGNVSFSDKAPQNIKAEQLYLSPANAYTATLPSPLPDPDPTRQITQSSTSKPDALSAAEENCGRLGLQLRTLKKQDAVYVDNKNMFRRNRENFSLGYVGSRDYLSDQQRQKETDKLEQTIKKHCGDTPDANKRQLEAMLKIKREERCGALKSRLQDLLKPAARTADSEIRNLKDEIELACSSDHEAYQRARKSRYQQLRGPLEILGNDKKD